MLRQKAECFFWYRPTRVVPEQKPLNGCCCCVVAAALFCSVSDYQDFVSVVLGARLAKTNLVEVDVQYAVSQVALPELGSSPVPPGPQTLLGVAKTACQQPSVAKDTSVII